MTSPSLRSRIRALYFGDAPHARRFRTALIAFDIASLAFFVASSFIVDSTWERIANMVIAAILVTDLGARTWIENRPMRQLRRVATWLDLVVIASLLLPLVAENFLFLRVLRVMRLFHSYHVLRDLRREYQLFRRNEEVIDASLNLMVFVFVMSAVVYVLQAHGNAGINNFVDALYFTVTTLTTTGYGDIVMRDTSGRLLAVAIMIVGFGLFLRLVQAIFRPRQRRHECPDCGLLRHDADAVHCKHCGRVIKIPNEGVDA